MILPKLSTPFVFYFESVFANSMKIGVAIISVGAIILGFGTLFFLQGNSVVGPTSSFMYSNPKWIGYGESIIALGLGIAVLGIVTSLRRPKS